MDNGKQFDTTKFRIFCAELGVKIDFASVGHPQTNGAVQRANGVLFSGISKKLLKGKWVQELTAVVWCHNSSELRPTKFTPIRLLYGKEAVTPEEKDFRSLRTTVERNPPKNHIANVEGIEGSRLQAAIKLTKYQIKTRSWHDKQVVQKDIKPGDFM